MCLRFLCCGDHDDNGPAVAHNDNGPAGGHQEPRPTPPLPHPRETSNQETDASPGWADARGKPKSGEAAVPQEHVVASRTNGPAHPGGGNKNGEHVAAVTDTDSSDTDVPSGGVFRGRKGAAENTTAPSAAPGAQAPQTKEYVAAGAPQPKMATDKMRAAPAPQVARLAEHDDDPAAANNVNGDPDHGGEDGRKPRGKTWW